MAPDNTVAAQRATYWANHISKHDEDIKVDVVTATADSSKDYLPNTNNVYTVKNTNSGLLAKLFKNDKGASWLYDLQLFFNKTETVTYDAVILTGNPFLHFFIIKRLKAIHKCKIFLDYRDPFSRNERVVNNSLPNRMKRQVLKFIEYYFNSISDHIIVMNEFCAQLLCSCKDTTISIIDNGFDESELKKAIPHKLVDCDSKTFVYLGSFASDRNVNNLLRVFESSSDNLKLVHIGKEDKSVSEYPNTLAVGLVPYIEAQGYAKACDVGVVLASGKKFESTTKIFDYIGLNLPILIITKGQKETGNIHGLTKDYPMVWWATDNFEDIERVIKDILKALGQPNVEFDASEFSRQAGLRKLISILVA